MSHDEKLVFYRHSENEAGVDFSHEDDFYHLDDTLLEQKLGDNLRKDLDQVDIPDLTEPSAVRHFTRLSKKNFSIDSESYPLGSCTMKYNPKLHEWAARLPGINSLHPYMPDHLLQEALKIYYELQNYLSIIGGFHKTSLNPSAGAQGEFSGLLMIKKALEDRKEKRSKILVPKSAHGTNPATASFFSYTVESIAMGSDGRILIDEVRRHMDAQCVGLMITNPNTLGIFESEQKEIAEIIHERGGYIYGDGANLNALMGKVKPGEIGVDVMHFNLHKTMTTPHGGGGPGCGAIGASKELAPYLPSPQVDFKDNKYFIKYNNKKSIGRIRSFLGNFGMIIRAWIYIRSLGAQGLTAASEIAVLNTNYMKKKLAHEFNLPYHTDCLHEVVFDDRSFAINNITALDIAKRLIDYGIHPPTMYFPLIVKGALMIEPTETESLLDLDYMINAFLSIAQEIKSTPELVKNAPHTTSLKRLDEAKAARKPVLTYKDLLKE